MIKKININIYIDIIDEILIKIFQVVGSRHRRKANLGNFQFFNFIFFLIVKIIENIFLIKPEELQKISETMFLIKKKIIKRYYTNPFRYNPNNLKFNDTFLDFAYGHNHHIITVSNVTWEKKSFIDESIIFFENYSKIDYTKIITKELNIDSNINLIENNLNFLIKKGRLTKEDVQLIMGNKKIINKQLIIEKGENINIIGIQNLTTSSKNATEIIRANILKMHPEKKGIYIYNNNIMIFFLQNKEEYRRLIWFLILLYKPDIINQKNLNLYEKNLNENAEKNMIEILDKEQINNIDFRRLKDSQEFESNKDTIFGYLLEELKK